MNREWWKPQEWARALKSLLRKLNEMPCRTWSWERVGQKNEKDDAQREARARARRKALIP